MWQKLNKNYNNIKEQSEGRAAGTRGDDGCLSSSMCCVLSPALHCLQHLYLAFKADLIVTTILQMSKRWIKDWSKTTQTPESRFKPRLVTPEPRLFKNTRLPPMTQLYHPKSKNMCVLKSNAVSEIKRIMCYRCEI